jgi:hypothetical protein
MENQLTQIKQQEFSLANFDKKIQGESITVYTSHEACIIEDEMQLSALVVRDIKPKVEEFDMIVGKFEVKGRIAKAEIVQTDNSRILQIIKLLILDIFHFFAKDISDGNIKSAAELIYKNYYWLKVSELKLFAERMKGGFWEQRHNLSAAVLMERLKEFADESLELREQIASYDTSKNVEEKPTELQEMFSKFAETLAKKYPVHDDVKITNADAEKEIEKIQSGIYKP